MVLTVGLVLLLSLILATAVSILAHMSRIRLSFPPTLLFAVDIVIVLAAATLLFALILKILPDVSLTWRDVWWGAFVAAALFSVGRGVIALYLSHSSLTSSYGTAGSLVAVLIWVYYSCAILFFGAHCCKVDHIRRKGPVKPAAHATPRRPRQMANLCDADHPHRPFEESDRKRSAVGAADDGPVRDAGGGPLLWPGFSCALGAGRPPHSDALLSRDWSSVSSDGLPPFFWWCASTFFCLARFAGSSPARPPDLAGSLLDYRYNIEQKLHAIQPSSDGPIKRFSQMVVDIEAELPGLGKGPAVANETPRAKPETAAPNNAAPVAAKPPANPLDQVRWLVSPFLGGLGTMGIVMVLVIFMLLKREDLRGRVIKMIGGGRISSTSRALEDAGDRVWRYLVTQLCVVSVTFGMVVGTVLYFLDVLTALSLGRSGHDPSLPFPTLESGSRPSSPW